MKAHRVAGLQLAKLPSFGLYDNRGADESSEARAVGTKQDGHIAGEIDRANGISIVVNVGGMQSCLSTIFARPLRFGSDQAHAGAVRLIMYAPIGREQHLNVFSGKKFGSGMRSIKDAHVPMPSV